MKAMLRLLGTPLTQERVDARVSRWVCFLCGLAQLGLAAVFFARHAQGPLEFAMGLSLSLAAFGVVTSCGIMTSRVALIEPKIPLRARKLELFSYALGLAILGGGCWVLTMLPMERVGVTMGLLVILGLSVGSIGAGAWWTCRRHARS